MKSFFAAVQFLTIVPCPARLSGGEQGLKGSVAFFPVVGLLIGVLAATLDSGFRYVFPIHLSSFLVVVALIAISGGLHLDGLADSADGFLSSRSREEMLKIMRDSRTGPMGVIAIVCVIGLKVFSLASVPPTIRWETILLMPIAGRSALVLTMTALPYARQEGGLATVYSHGRLWPHAVLAISLLFLAGWLGASGMGLVACAASIAMTFMVALYAYRKVGGFTGDILGASCEIVELVPALVAAAWASQLHPA